MNSELENELESLLGFCGCGSEDILEHVRKTFALMARWSDLNGKVPQDEHDAIYRELRSHLGMDAHSTLAHVYLFHFTHLDLIEHGSGVRCSWLTIKGREVLTKLEAWAAERELKG